jgi:hypothetical protein
MIRLSWKDFECCLHLPNQNQIIGVSVKFLVFSKIRNIFRVFTVLETVWGNSVSRFRAGA